MEKIEVSNKIIDLIKKSSNILIIASRPVDLDSIGSAVILKKQLERSRKVVRAVCPNSIPDYIKLFPLVDEIEVYDPKDISLDKYDLIFALDGGNTKQFAMVEYDSDFNFQNHKRVVNIDHHTGNSKFTSFRIYEPGFSSTAEIVLSSLVNISRLSKKELTLAYASLVFDTGNFKYSIKAGTLRMAALLIEKGADADFVVNQCFYDNSKSAYLIFSHLIKKTIYNDSLRYSYVEADYEFLKDKYKLKAHDIDEGVMLYHDFHSRAVRNIWIGIVKKKYNKFLRVNMRGNNLYNKIPLTDIVKHFSKEKIAAGHFNSTGFNVKKEDLDDIDIKLEEYIQKLFIKYYKDL